MSDTTPKGAAKTLTDGDISTVTRRAGPASDTPGDDVDTHADPGDIQAATDHDTAIDDTAPNTDKDT